MIHRPTLFQYGFEMISSGLISGPRQPGIDKSRRYVAGFLHVFGMDRHFISRTHKQITYYHHWTKLNPYSTGLNENADYHGESPSTLLRQPDRCTLRQHKYIQNTTRPSLNESIKKPWGKILTYVSSSKEPTGMTDVDQKIRNQGRCRSL